MKVIVGTNNQKKLEAVRQLFEKILGVTPSIISLVVESGVAEAPMNESVLIGALNRAKACASKDTAEFYIGIESGLVERFGDIYEEAWAVVIDRNNEQHKGYSSGLMLPKVVTNAMDHGQLHDEIMSDWDARLQLPDDNRDTWSRYSGGKISRIASFEEALRNTLVQISDSQDSLYSISTSQKAPTSDS